MQHHVVVSGVAVMSVAVPVRGPHMYLDGTGPDLLAYAYDGVEEVRAGTPVQFSLVYHLDALSVAGRKLTVGPQTVSPHILQQVFH